MKLAFYKAFQPNATLLDKTIAICTFGKYSHVEVVFSDSMAFSISPRDKMSRFKRIDFNPEHWDFVELNITKKEEDYIRAMSYQYQNYKYDYVGAITSATLVCIQKDNKLFCSELASKMIRNSKKYCGLKKDCRYSPNELFNFTTKANR